MAYPEQVSITTGEVTKENASVTYTVNAGSLPAEPSTTAGVAKSPAGSLYPSYEGAPSDVEPEPTDEESGLDDESGLDEESGSDELEPGVEEPVL